MKRNYREGREEEVGFSIRIEDCRVRCFLLGHHVVKCIHPVVKPYSHISTELITVPSTLTLINEHKLVDRQELTGDTSSAC